MENENKPEIRFIGFEGEWEEKRLGDVLLVQRGGSPRPIQNFITNNTDGINWIKIGDVAVGSRYVTETKEKIIPEGERYSRRVFKGDLILSNSMSFGRPYIMQIDGCIHDGWLLIRDEMKLFNIEYLLQLLSSDYMLQQYKSKASGGVVINLNSELVQSTNIFKPLITEQKLIGNFFENIDKLITEHQQKHSKLKSLKKAMLDKMFPKQGRRVPEIRFKGFEGDWIKDSLGELTFVYDGTHQTPKYTESGVMFLSVENIKDLKSNKYISNKAFEEEFNNYPENGDVLMTRIGDVGTANVVETNEPIAYYVSLALLKKRKLDAYFLKESIGSEEVRNDIWRRTLHIAFPKKINKNEIEKVQISFPASDEEQKKIGDFFKQISQLISLHLTEIEKLNNLKKALSAKMFV